MRWVDNEGRIPYSFVTDTGCTVRVVPHRTVGQGSTGNTLLILRMDQPDDGREAEVMLSPEECLALQILLERRGT